MLHSVCVCPRACICMHNVYVNSGSCAGMDSILFRCAVHVCILLLLSACEVQLCLCCCCLRCWSRWLSEGLFVPEAVFIVQVTVRRLVCTWSCLHCAGECQKACLYLKLSSLCRWLSEGLFVPEAVLIVQVNVRRLVCTWSCLHCAGECQKACLYLKLSSLCRMRKMKKKFESYPAFAYECSLYDIVPVDEVIWGWAVCVTVWLNTVIAHCVCNCVIEHYVIEHCVCDCVIEHCVIEHCVWLCHWTLCHWTLCRWLCHWTLCVWLCHWTLSLNTVCAVSYTHLTLPTSCCV